MRPALLLAFVPAMLAACASGPHTAGLGGADYSRSQARAPQQVEIGTVEAVRRVTIDATEPGFQNSLAPAAGALVGGVLGSNIGNGKGKMVATVLGALAGGAAGSAVDHARNTIPGVEITVRLKRGDVAITQADEGIPFKVGGRVRVMSDYSTTRVAPD